MPPPLLGRSPYGSADPLLFQKEDPWGWPVTEYEEGFEFEGIPYTDAFARARVVGEFRDHAPRYGRRPAGRRPP